MDYVLKVFEPDMVTHRSSSTIREAKNIFHCNFKANMQINTLLEFLFFQINQVD
jgi:hypothetical protein